MPKLNIKKAISFSVRNSTKAIFKLSKSAKDKFENVNPINKKIDKSTTTDHGVEALRLGYTTGKKISTKAKGAYHAGKRTIKTTKSTIKGTQKALKTSAKVTKKTAKLTAKATVKVAKVTTKVVVTVAKVTLEIISKIVAALANPVVLIVLLVLIVIVSLFSYIAILFGGVGANVNVKNRTYNAAGLIDVPDGFAKGVEYYTSSVESKKNDLVILLNEMFYNYNNLKESDLVYMEQSSTTGTTTVYETSFATDERKNELYNAFDINLAISPVEFISIVYVYLEKEKNKLNETTYSVYEIEFTPEVFLDIFGKAIVMSHDTYYDQKCPHENCSVQITIIDNPDYKTAFDNQQKSVFAYNDWGEIVDLFEYSKSLFGDLAKEIFYLNVIQYKINDWIIKYNRYPTAIEDDPDGRAFMAQLGDEYLFYDEVLKNTPEKITSEVITCEYKHKLHALGIHFYDKESLMDLLEFDDYEKKWVGYTENAFQDTETEE